MIVFTESADKARRIQHTLMKAGQRSAVSLAAYIPLTFPINTTGLDRNNKPIIEPYPSDVNKLRKHAQHHATVALAYAPDDHGDGLAWRVYYHLYEKFPHKRYIRLRLAVISDASLAEALAKEERVSSIGFESYMTRRIVNHILRHHVERVTNDALMTPVPIGYLDALILNKAVQQASSHDRFQAVATLGDGTTVMSVRHPSAATLEKMVRSAEGPKVFRRRIVRPPPAPFTTTTLMEAITRLGFDVQATFDFLKVLHNRGILSYPYTSGSRLPESAVEDTRAILQGVGVPLRQICAYGHSREPYGIFPTSMEHGPDKMRARELATLYRIIWSRTIMSQMEDAVIKQTRLVWSYRSKPVFTATYEHAVHTSWLRLDPEFCSSDPPVDTAIRAVDIEESTPYLRADEVPALLSVAEVPGSWRYKNVVSYLVRTGLVRTEELALIPTDLGRAVDAVINKAFPTLLRSIPDMEMLTKAILTDSAITAPVVIDYVNRVMQTADSGLLLTGPCPRCGEMLKVKALVHDVVLLCRKCRKRKRATVKGQQVVPR